MLGSTGEAEGERLMISECSELAALIVVTKRFYCEEDGQQFTIKSAVLLLSVGEFTRKEGHRAPDTINKLLKLATDCPVGGIHRAAGFGMQVRVLEEDGRRQSKLGREES